MTVPLEYIKYILDALHEPALILEPSLQPVMFNPAFTRMFGSALNGASGNLLASVNCEPSLETLIAPVMASGGEVDGAETVYTSPIGQRIFLMVYARRIRTTDLPEMILVELKNISREHEDEHHIQELNKAHRTRVNKIKGHNTELESYSHTVAHNLRTPLRFMNRISHLLLQNPDANLSESAIQQLNMILNTTNEMAKLIESLMLFSQAHQIPLKKRRIDLKALFQEAANELLQEQAGCKVNIDIHFLAPCKGDRLLLKEVALNLLENAIKFTYKQKDARIVIGCTDSTLENVYFIQDNGVGFNQEKMDDLFVPFHRLQNATDFNGLGIGLALVKRIIERHGGQIWAESHINKGATFYFTLGNGILT